MIHVATIHLTEPYEGEAEHYFASLDGESFLPVSRKPAAGEEDQIAALFEGNGRIRPMRYARRALSVDWWRGIATDVTHEEVGKAS